MTKTDKNHRAINCDTCDTDGDPTQLQAWASDWLLKREGAISIEFIDDDTLRNLARQHPEDCAIEDHCHPCNGPDDGNDGNQDD